jgi:ribonuclease P protein component
VGDVWRIRSTATFASLGRTRHRARQGPVWVRWVPPPDGSVAGPPEVAFAIGRKVGGAVVRNRLRRRLRAILGDLDLAPGAYLVGVSAGPEAASLSFAQLSALVGRAMTDVVPSR